MNKYIYEGPIIAFGERIKSMWKSETISSCSKKAKSIFVNQAISVCGLTPNSKVSLPGNLYLMKGGVD